MAHARQSRFPRTDVKRKTAWGIGPSESDTPGGSSAATFTSLWANGVAAQAVGLTTIRTRGYIQSLLIQGAAVGDGYHLGFGIRIMTPEAFAVGITATPTPFADMGDNGWLYHIMWTLVVGEIAGFVAPSASRLIEIDSKAMRKFPSPHVMVGVMEGVEIGTASVEWSGRVRQLDKLP